MEKINLIAQKRDLLGKKVKQLRMQGQLPAVFYGQGNEGENIAISLGDFKKAYKKAGSSSLIDLEIGEAKPVKTIVKRVQFHPVNDQPLHVDFYKIKMDEAITTSLPLNFLGESAAVKELEGNLITNKDSIEIECLPADLVSHIDVDIGKLATFDDVIKISDLNIPANIKVLDDLEETVVLVTPPRSEEELAQMEQETAVDTEKAQIEKMEVEAEAEKAEKPEEEEKAAEVGEKKEEK